MFEHMDISESICEGAVEPSYKETNRTDATRDGHSRLKRGEPALSNTYSDMSESAGKRRKIYVDYPKGKYKPTCLIHGPRNSSDECKVLGDCGSKYVKSRPTKDRRQNTAPRKKFNRQQENNAIVNSTMDEILLQKNQKVNNEKEAHENVESDFDESELYQIDNMSLDDTKKLE